MVADKVPGRAPMESMLERQAQLLRELAATCIDEDERCAPPCLSLLGSATY